MPRITQIKVVYSRTRQPQQYESQRAEVELTAVLDEGEELGDATREYLELAREEVHRAIGIAPRPAAAPAPQQPRTLPAGRPGQGR